MPSSKEYQGGKEYGQLKEKQSEQLEEINKEFLENEDYQEVEDLAEKLQSSKETFLKYDQEDTGELDIMDVKFMMEKLGQAKTHLEIKKMIDEVDTTNNSVITYRDFVRMMLGKQHSVLKLILQFEDKAKGENKVPKGPPPKRDLSSLP